MSIVRRAIAVVAIVGALAAIPVSAAVTENAGRLGVSTQGQGSWPI